MTTIETKTCTQCKTNKPLSEFHKGKGADGKSWECKECGKLRRAGILRVRRILFVSWEKQEKECLSCFEVKSFNLFEKGRNTCKACRAKDKKDSYVKKGSRKRKEKRAKERVKTKWEIEQETQQRTCARCKRLLPFENFYKRIHRGKKNLLCYCKECLSERAKERAATRTPEERERVLLRKRKYVKENVKVRAEYNKRWAQDNPEKRKAIVQRSLDKNPGIEKVYQKRYRQKHPDKNNLRSSLARAKKMKLTQPSHDLIKEGLLRKEMRKLSQTTGKTHALDHIFPMGKGGPNHHDNLQILTKSVNSRKSDRLDFYDEGIHWTQLKTCVLEMIDPVKLLAAYKEIGKKPPKRIQHHLIS